MNPARSTPIEILVMVWGEFHWGVFLNATLPNVLSSGNIPSLGGPDRVKVRFFTIPEDRDAYITHPLIQTLGQHGALEFVTPLDNVRPDTAHHVMWIHRAALEAARNQAALFILPPDTMWNDGAFARAADAIDNGYDAVITPLLQTVLETIVPAAKAAFHTNESSPMTIPARDLVRLSMAHIHPVSSLAFPASPNARPAIDHYWPSGAQGLVAKHSQREMFAFVPHRCPPTLLWYPDTADSDRILFIEDSDDIAMLSLDPLSKNFRTYILDHRLQPLDIARSSTHPMNDMSLIDFYTSRDVRWHTDIDDTSAWAAAASDADAYFRRVRNGHLLMRLWHACNENGCSIFAKALAVAVNVTDIQESIATGEPGNRHIEVFLPADSYLKSQNFDLQTLVTTGRENALKTFVLDFVAADASPTPRAPRHRTISGTADCPAITILR